MTTMIERVQSAIVNAVLREGDRIDPNVAEECARAAIEAMREPTPHQISDRVIRAAGYAGDIDVVWRLMIDAALAERPDE